MGVSKEDAQNQNTIAIGAQDFPNVATNEISIEESNVTHEVKEVK